MDDTGGAVTLGRGLEDDDGWTHDVVTGPTGPGRGPVGERSEGYYQLVSGLNEGDRVVASANFLVDSESSMKAALESMAGGAPQP